jgi:biopolymer transport protein ExbD
MTMVDDSRLLFIAIEKENEIRVNAGDAVLSLEKFRERLDLYSSIWAKEDLSPAVKLYIDPSITGEHAVNIINALNKAEIYNLRLTETKSQKAEN